MNKIYHYLFDFDKQTIECTEGTYEIRYPKYRSSKLGQDGNEIVVDSRNSKKILRLCDIGTVQNGKYVLLFERDDEGLERFS